MRELDPAAAAAALAAAERAPSVAQLRDFLALVRESRARMPEEVFAHGSALLAHRGARGLPAAEAWQLREEVAAAALATGRPAAAAPLTAAAERHFGAASARAARLRALAAEAAGAPERAEAIYSQIDAADPGCALAARRRAALAAGRGDLPGAAAALRAWLDVHQGDAAGWEEAASLYLRAGDLPRAAFCLEERALLAGAGLPPSDRLLLAETLYTAGGAANWREARRQFAAVLEATKGGSARALYGACAAAAQLAGERRGRGGGSGGDDGGEDAGAAAEGAALAALAAEELVARYGAAAAGKLPLVKAMLTAQGLL
jgi:hypothetical protein